MPVAVCHTRTNDSVIRPDQLLDSSALWSSHRERGWGAAVKENAGVPAAAAFTAGDVLIRSPALCKQVSDAPVRRRYTDDHRM